MKKSLRTILSLILCAVTVVLAVPVTAKAPEKTVTSADFDPADLRCDGYDLAKYITPFWKGNIVYNEVVMPITDKNGLPLPLTLMYEPTEIVSVKNYTLTETYEYGRDYTLEDGKVIINRRGNIPTVHNAKLHPSVNPFNKDWDEFYPRADGNGFEYWNEGSEISMMCLAVTYIHNGEWSSDTPDSVAQSLPQTMSRLIHKEKLNIVLIGDSVGTGAKSSAQCGIAPFADAYPEMMRKGLELKFGNPNITLINSSIGGTTSEWTTQGINNTVVSKDPDLVIINYGMNDSSADRVGYTDERFRTNMSTMIEYIKVKCPDAEILLLASLYGNIYTFRAERYDSHATILHDLAEIYDGVGVCDPLAIERPLIEQGLKKFVDFMADNMVHPNDLGMRLIAQTVVDAFRVNDIKEYGNVVLEDLTAHADADSHVEDGKRDELIELLDQARTELYGCASEWDVNDAVTDIYARIDAILRRCQPEDHIWSYAVTPATCKKDGYVTATCGICDWQEITETIPRVGGEHIWDSGRKSVSPTYKRDGVFTHTCTKCGEEINEAIPRLTGAKETSGGMLHVIKGYNYMEGNGAPYHSGDGTVEYDICPIDTDMNGEGTSYVGVWFANYTIAAAYNFRMQRFELVKTNLPYSGSATMIVGNYLPWRDGEWHKFAVNIKGTTVSIYWDGRLVLTDTDKSYNSADNVPLFYSVGEYYLDNAKICSKGYDPATGENATRSWDFNTEASQRDFDKSWGYGSYTPLEYVVPTAATECTAIYSAHEHDGTYIGTVVPGCALPGYDEYECKTCGEVYKMNFTEPVCGTHDFTESTVKILPTEYRDGEAVFGCKNCDMTFTTAIPAGTKTDKTAGDVNGDGTVNAKDVSALMKHFAGWNVTVDPLTADFDGDENVVMKDVSALLKYLAGWQ